VKNPWVKYTLIRLGSFIVLTSILTSVGFDWVFAVMVAAVLSFAFSLIFLNKMRDQLSSGVYKRINKGAGAPDDESDLENKLLDEQTKNPE
jgi:MFS superfamily sulfate permease-like transporter